MSKNNLNIKILSVGGRGANILDRLNSFDDIGIDRIAVALNSKVFSRIRVKQRIELTKEYNLDKVENIETVVKQSIEEKRGEIEKSIRGANALFLIGNLANDTTHYQVAQIAKIAKENDILTFFVGSTPFPFEGKNKIDLANKNKEFLENYVDAVLVLESAKIMMNKISANEALTRVDKLLGEMISSLVDLVMKFGVVNVDFADLKSTIQNAGEIFFNSIDGTKSDVGGLVNDLFVKNQFANKNNKLKKVLYVIYAGKDVLMEEIGVIGEKLKENLDSNARVIFGVINEEKMGDRLKIVLVGC
ncbi:MAG TPA: hypothetical protein DEB73_00755 [Candidatus Magasanikbacteria bacterium]|uniref:Cell division protein FtsZ n=1 Tax=Candidatus Magasanikbacteria bacterium GW2011_GWC2_41_17 TaxID=1619048 RepID=A0A0G0V835_9BACT|nr:MAG: Cell division protein FtsZ [Candidatus Magasanikbacteria bacterium GW2011_GWC2_41_17]HBV57788.1 hypothetical protein [Candidatus Magasanikbacteria bacterium]